MFDSFHILSTITTQHNCHSAHLPLSTIATYSPAMASNVNQSSWSASNNQARYLERPMQYSQYPPQEPFQPIIDGTNTQNHSFHPLGMSPQHHFHGCHVFQVQGNMTLPSMPSMPSLLPARMIQSSAGGMPPVYHSPAEAGPRRFEPEAHVTSTIPPIQRSDDVRLRNGEALQVQPKPQAKDQPAGDGSQPAQHAWDEKPRQPGRGSITGGSIHSSLQPVNSAGLRILSPWQQAEIDEYLKVVGYYGNPKYPALPSNIKPRVSNTNPVWNNTVGNVQPEPKPLIPYMTPANIKLLRPSPSHSVRPIALRRGNKQPANVAVVTEKDYWLPDVCDKPVKRCTGDDDNEEWAALFRRAGPSADVDGSVPGGTSKSSDLLMQPIPVLNAEQILAPSAVRDGAAKASVFEPNATANQHMSMPEKKREPANASGAPFPGPAVFPSRESLNRLFAAPKTPPGLKPSGMSDTLLRQYILGTQARDVAATKEIAALTEILKTTEVALRAAHVEHAAALAQKEAHFDYYTRQIDETLLNVDGRSEDALTAQLVRSLLSALKENAQLGGRVPDPFAADDGAKTSRTQLLIEQLTKQLRLANRELSVSNDRYELLRQRFDDQAAEVEERMAEIEEVQQSKFSCFVERSADFFTEKRQVIEETQKQLKEERHAFEEVMAALQRERGAHEDARLQTNMAEVARLAAVAETDEVKARCLKAENLAAMIRKDYDDKCVEKKEISWDLQTAKDELLAHHEEAGRMVCQFEGELASTRAALADARKDLRVAHEYIRKQKVEDAELHRTALTELTKKDTLIEELAEKAIDSDDEPSDMPEKTKALRRHLRKVDSKLPHTCIPPVELLTSSFVRASSLKDRSASDADAEWSPTIDQAKHVSPSTLDQVKHVRPLVSLVDSEESKQAI
ncbi:uncharacterized protein VDAG_00712 [Verticillium dahliae VdLs.17]|uniref:Uncharacterized protein n=1 Tax=Verticillium dahliae (strain VdLs.17 / ATCC MYA-4575 / FGSC 10137) TaxID=498257 RepID=G2WQS0_VERDV|nr:uncharacterized protein VDAG_00712 [Verticillium dahliae VdLs.17]EGY14030.1 hypothetical protein VDAG_00712 [Verticillium dahliae VdLs.17]KAH6710517.1 hypothetical protein EV126DRAFT_476580 [Verticillium dahliae]